MKYFIASSWANMKQVQLLTENLKALDHQVFSYTDQKNFVPDAKLNENSFDGKDWESDPEVRQSYQSELEGLRQSDAFIMLLPAGNSSHIEAGIAFALNKHTILVGNPEKTETHYLIFNQHFKEISDLLQEIKNKKTA